jgi:hypothetical protein
MADPITPLPTTPGAEMADAGTPAEMAAPTPADAITTPAPAPVQTPTPAPVQQAPTPAPTAPAAYAPAEEQFSDLIGRARQSGFNEQSLQEGIDSYNRGGLNQTEFEQWLNRFINPDGEVQTAINNTVEGANQPEAPITPVPTPEDDVKKAQDDYERTMAEVTDTYKESQDALVTSAEDRYNAEMRNLNDALALQQQLAAQQQALIASSTDIQKQEAKNAYEANLAGIELQKKKVKEAYDSMKEEQKLLNTQRKVREETAIGLIYGGFGSAAANKNIEETIIRGERELMNLSKEAVNKDTELQNEVVNLTKSYELDVRKIEQWKAEQNADIYATLSSYVQEITADKNMAAVEKGTAIRDAVTKYNEKVAEIYATVAETRMNLSMEMLDRADRLKQQEFNNRITQSEEQRKAETYEYEKKRTVINNSREDLDLILTSYAKQDYAQLPSDVLAQIKNLEEQADLPSGAGQQIMEAIRADELKQGDVVKEFTNSITGEVTAIRYNFDTGKVETMKLGALETPDAPKSVWTKVGEDADGNIISMNEVTGEFRTQGKYSGASGSPEDAMAIPDGSYGGQCGHFVNQYTGLELGNTYGEKMQKMDLTITTPEAGMVFVMPIDGSSFGHTGFIESIDSRGMATVKDSNWYQKSNPETVQTHQIHISKMTGFVRVTGDSSESADTSMPETPSTTPEASSSDNLYFD